MNRILELRQARAALIDLAGQILTKAADEKRALTTEEDARYSVIFADAEANRATADAEERQAAVVSQLASSRLETASTTHVSPDQAREASIAAVRSYLLTNAVAAEYRSIMLPGNQDAPNFRSQAEGTLNLGGYTVPQGFWSEVQEAMRYFGGLRQSRTKKITTTQGNLIPVPTSDDTSNIGRLLSENTQVVETAIQFGVVNLQAFKWSSDILLVPYELLQDTGVDLEAFLISRLAERLARIQNQFFTLGSGTSQPQGVVVGATSGKVGASGQIASIIYNDLVDLKYSVNRAYRDTAEWMMNDATLAVILKLVDSVGRPLFESQFNVSLQSGEPDRLFGQNLIVNNDMAVMAANAKAVLYGAFGNYWIRDVQAMLMLRLTERYADFGQIAFLGFCRSDGRMVDAGQHPIKYYANAAS